MTERDSRGHSHHDSVPGRTLTDVLAALAPELSLPARLGYVGVLLASLTMTGVITTLWLTEPGLPMRTSVAFGVLVMIGLGWVMVTGLALTRRRPLYARDRVLATGMAVTATAIGGGGTAALAVMRAGVPGGLVAATATVAATAVALVLHVRARRRRRALLARRSELERQLAAGSDPSR